MATLCRPPFSTADIPIDDSRGNLRDAAVLLPHFPQDCVRSDTCTSNGHIRRLECAIVSSRESPVCRSAEKSAMAESARSRAIKARMLSNSFSEVLCLWAPLLASDFVQVTLTSFHMLFPSS